MRLPGPARTLDVIHQQQLAAEKFGISPQFRVGESVAGNRQENAEYIAEVVDHDRVARLQQLAANSPVYRDSGPPSHS